MSGSQRAHTHARTRTQPLAAALNHQIIGFMSVTHVEIIANVPRVTSGKVCNGAIYKFFVVIRGKYPDRLPRSSFMAAHKSGSRRTTVAAAIKINTAVAKAIIASHLLCCQRGRAFWEDSPSSNCLLPAVE